MPRSRYSENAKDFEPDPITFKTYKRYLDENGPEKAQGYLDAMKQINGNLELFFDRYDERHGFEIENSPHRVRTSLQKFVDETRHLIDRIEKSNPGTKAAEKHIE